MLVRALLISSLYNITSFRRLCFAISENIAFRWFCFLTIDDKVFDHSTISYFIERVGNEGFVEIFQLFNEELLRLGLLSPKMYADASLVRASVGGHNLSPSGMSVNEFEEKAVEENGLSVLREQQTDEDGAIGESVSHYQDPKGQLRLSEVDTDSRWRTTRHDRRPNLHYQENVTVDRGGCIVARKATHASGGDWRPLIGMLQQLPIRPESLAADTGYNDGRLRKYLKDLDIPTYIPVHPNQEGSMVTRGGFDFRSDHLVRPEGKRLNRGSLIKKDRQYLYVVHQKDCQQCPVNTECLPKGQKRRFVSLSMYYPLFLEAREHNRRASFQEEMAIRRTAAEGVFASQDRLGWASSRLRGLWKVDCEGYMSALAHNLKKAMRRLDSSAEPPEPRRAVVAVGAPPR